MTKYMTGAELPLPILGFKDLPQGLTRFEVVCDAQDFVIVKCEFYLTEETYGKWSEDMKPVVQKYRLVKVEDEAPGPAANDVQQEVAHG